MSRERQDSGGDVTWTFDGHDRYISVGPTAAVMAIEGCGGGDEYFWFEIPLEEFFEAMDRLRAETLLTTSPLPDNAASP